MIYNIISATNAAGLINVVEVCYYPAARPQAQWDEDAKMMADLDLTYVRIGEFAWSRLEPNPGEYDFAWLDKAVATLAKAGLKVVMGTPTATPPKWLIDQYPEILPVDPDTGRTRGFGSRRHYDFSSPVYLRESLRITEVLARRSGMNDAVAGCFRLYTSPSPRYRPQPRMTSSS